MVDNGKNRVGTVAGSPACRNERQSVRTVGPAQINTTQRLRSRLILTHQRQPVKNRIPMPTSFILFHIFHF